MNESFHRKRAQAPALLLGILLTLLAVLGHRFLPERHLLISSAREGANFFLVETGVAAQSENTWVDQSKFHYACKVPDAVAYQGCGFAFMLAGEDVSQGIDLSHYKTLHLAVSYTGKAQYLRIGLAE